MLRLANICFPHRKLLQALTKTPNSRCRAFSTKDNAFPPLNDQKETKVNYSATLNLPQTNFPMRANAKEREPNLIFHSYYKWQEQKNQGLPFVLHDGPPYANGSPHIGHALNKILKDIICRYKALRGYRVSYIPGWDCHGLPIELKALEEMKKTKQTSGLRQFARKYANFQIEEQKKSFQKWGVMGDWDNFYTTMAPEYEARQLGVFQAMFKKGLIYRGVKPVYWSPSSITALAEAELEYSDDHVSPSVYVRFPIDNYGSLSSEIRHKYPNLSLLIWTTTPWTLPANKAICIDSKSQYSIVKVGSDFAIVAESLVETLSTKFGCKLETLQSIRGDSLLGVTYSHPFRPQTSPVLHGDHVTLDSGTGLVHTAPGHGLDDFQVCRQHQIPVFTPVDDHGKFTIDAGEKFVGKFVLGEGNEEVLKTLEELGVLAHKSLYKHRYPYDWRTKKPVIVRATEQWFADLGSVKDVVLETLKKEGVGFIPAHGALRLSAMVGSRNDWCISRQREWGVPIPVFYHVDSLQPLLTDQTIAYIQSLFQTSGAQVWWDSPVVDLLPPDLKKDAHLYIKGTDTMDVWFDSGSSWDAVINQRGLPKADIYLEGSDQHRGWFQSSLVTSVCAEGSAPFKKIITHGFVLDGEGRKMSKSIGNVISPEIIIKGGKVGSHTFEGWGVDPLRFWAASVDYTGDVSVSSELMEEVANHVRKLRNTARFMLGNLSDGAETDQEPGQPDIQYEDLCDLDKYMLHKTYQFIAQMTQHYDNYTFSKAVSLLLNFGNIELSSFYFDVLKDRLYTSSKKSHHRKSALYTLRQILRAFTACMAPILVHTSEDIYNHSPKIGAASSIFQCGWFDGEAKWENAELNERWNYLRQMKAAFNSQFEEEEKKKNENIKTTLDVSLTIQVKEGSSLASYIHFLGPQASEIFLSSLVNWNVIAKSELSAWKKLLILLEWSAGEVDYVLKISEATSTKCPRCWKRLEADQNLFCDKAQCPKHENSK